MFVPMFDQLESRLFMSASVKLAGSVLTFTGTPAADHIFADVRKGKLIVGQTTGAFSPSSKFTKLFSTAPVNVTKIVMNGMGGNDELRLTQKIGVKVKGVLQGWGGDDSLIGGNGPDTLIGGNGPDTLNGGNGIDFLTGFGGVDELDGGLGADVIVGGKGNDKINSFDGNDNDFLDGGPGFDRAIVDNGVGTFIEIQPRELTNVEVFF